MNRWLKILVVCILMLSCRESVVMDHATRPSKQAIPTGEIKQDKGTSAKDIESRDFCLCAQGCEYAPVEHSSQSARIRGSNVRRTSAGTKVFIKAGSLINISSPSGFVPERSRFVSGLLSTSSHFILLRKFRL